jgi:hypothetical protein
MTADLAAVTVVVVLAVLAAATWLGGRSSVWLRAGSGALAAVAAVVAGVRFPSTGAPGADAVLAVAFLFLASATAPFATAGPSRGVAWAPVVALGVLVVALPAGRALDPDGVATAPPLRRSDRRARAARPAAGLCPRRDRTAPRQRRLRPHRPPVRRVDAASRLPPPLSASATARACRAKAWGIDAPRRREVSEITDYMLEDAIARLEDENDAMEALAEEPDD